MFVLPAGADLLVLLCLLLALFASAMLGTALFERVKSPDQGIVAAWGMASLWLTLGGAVGIGLSWLTAALIVPLAWAGLRLARRRWRPDPQALRVAVLLLPALVVAAGKGPSEVDEFMHWLPNAAYLVERDAFPTAAAPGASTYPAFPYNLAFVVFVVSRLSGQIAEQAAVLLNVALCGVLALLLACAGGGASERSRWVVAAVAVLGASALNPSFVPKIVFTNYADFATGVALALAGWLMVALLRALRAGEARPWAMALQLGFVLAAFVNLKQANVVLAVLLAAGGLALAALEGRRAAVQLIALTPGWVGPAAAAYLAWRWYVARHLAGFGENAIRPRAEWQVDALAEILASIGGVFLKKGGYTALIVLAAVIAVRGIVRKRDDIAARLAQLGVLVVAGYAAALLFLYVAHFPAEAGRNAQSFWRYQTQLGPLLLIAAAAAVGKPLAERWARLGPRLRAGIGAALVASVVVGPVAHAGRIRFDLQAPKPVMEAIAREIGGFVRPGDALVLAAPAGLGEFDRFRFRLRHAGYALRYWDGEPGALLESHAAPGFVWLYCAPPGLGARVALDVPRESAALLHHGPGGWSVVKTWPLGRAEAVRKPDGCPA